MARFRNSNPARSGSGFWENLFWDHRKIRVINGVNNAVSCYKEAVQFSASFVT